MSITNSTNKSDSPSADAEPENDPIHPSTDPIRSATNEVATRCPSCGQALAAGAWRCASGLDVGRGCGKILGGDHDGVGQRGDK